MDLSSARHSWSTWSSICGRCRRPLRLGSRTLALLLTAALAACATNPLIGGPNNSLPQPGLTPPPKNMANAPPSESLIGKQGTDLLALLGAPGLVRKDKGVEVWQYARGSCVLILYLYDDKAGARRVTYLEAMAQGLVPSSASAVTPETCLAEQMRAVPQKPAKKTS